MADIDTTDKAGPSPAAAAASDAGEGVAEAAATLACSCMSSAPPSRSLRRKPGDRALFAPPVAAAAGAAARGATPALSWALWACGHTAVAGEEKEDACREFRASNEEM